MRSPSRRLQLTAAGACCCLLALVLAAGVAGGVALVGHQRPPSASPELGVDALVEEYDVAGGDAAAAVRGGRDLLGLGAEAAAEQDYGFVDPPPDTHHRGGAAPIPHS
ncbi:hypothetical protein BS78_02G271400 [Paspalum vaginatum]|nr:hypothetical protein BS78_02G271400 [Paspalum vaginatum]